MWAGFNWQRGLIERWELGPGGVVIRPGPKLWLLNPPHVRYIAKEAELASELWRHNISIIAAVIIQHWGLRCGGVVRAKLDQLNIWKESTGSFWWSIENAK